MKVYTLEQACLTHLSILINCVTLAQLYKTILTPMTTSLILMPTYLIMIKDYIFLLHLKESISFLKPRYQHNDNLMIVHMLILHQILNGIPQRLGFLMLQITLKSLWITMFCIDYFMLSYKYFYPKDFLTCGGPHIFRICI